jgi:argininosuccinate lyase
MKTPEKLWGGRFRSPTLTETEKFTESTAVDSRMIAQDIWGSQAHAIMLARQGIISDTDLCELLRWLCKVEEDFRAGKFALKPEKEDVHMNVESYLIEGAGPDYGGKLHTARSRNDQALVDAHLVAREHILSIQRDLLRLCRCFLSIARAHYETVMPGYTHTQHAQPISLAFWATAYVSMFLRDQRRLSAAYELANVNPLGACALAGASFPIDRRLTTKLLGFDAVHEHALDAVGSRDFIAEILFALALLMTNLSRLSEEIIYWTTYEFGIATLDDAYSTGSSIMPQKKNADIAELTRGRTGHVYAALLDLLITLKGLPMGYNRDLQEDKQPLWEAFDVVQACLRILPGLLETTEFNTNRMEALANANFATATELANFLVSEQGLPFRKAHEIVGGVVGDLVRMGKTFRDWDDTYKQLQARGIELSVPQLQRILDPILAIHRNRSLGGTSPAEVRRMAGAFDARLNEIEAEVQLREQRIDAARQLTLKVIEQALDGKRISEIEI